MSETTNTPWEVALVDDCYIVRKKTNDQTLILAIFPAFNEEEREYKEDIANKICEYFNKIAEGKHLGIVEDAFEMLIDNYILRVNAISEMKENKTTPKNYWFGQGAMTVFNQVIKELQEFDFDKLRQSR